MPSTAPLFVSEVNNSSPISLNVRSLDPSSQATYVLNAQPQRLGNTYGFDMSRPRHCCLHVVGQTRYQTRPIQAS